MKINKIWTIQSLYGLFLICILFLSACNPSANDKPSMRQPLSSEEIMQRAEAFEAVVAKNAEAWNAKDIDAIQAVLTEDIHFVDASAHDNIKGIRQVMTMARSFCRMFPDLQRQATNHYIGVEEGMAIYDYWGRLFVGKEYTPENPWIYVFLYKTQGDLISEWHLFEGYEILDRHFLNDTASEEFREVISTYVSAWSSGEKKAVAAMYAKEAVRRDALFEESQQGSKAIQDFADSFFTWYPDATWTPMEMFGEKKFRDKPQAVGSSFKIEVIDSVGEVCEIEAIILLHVFEGKIVQEDIYYEPISLIECGWAE